MPGTTYSWLPIYSRGEFYCTWHHECVAHVFNPDFANFVTNTTLLVIKGSCHIWKCQASFAVKRSERCGILRWIIFLCALKTYIINFTNLFNIATEFNGCVGCLIEMPGRNLTNSWGLSLSSRQSYCVKLSGLSKTTYQSSMKSLECLLEVNQRLGMRDLAVQFCCSEAVNMASEILQRWGSSRGHTENHK